MSTSTRAMLVSALILLGVFFPWWMSLPLALYLAAMENAYELIPYGFLLDRLYGSTPSIAFGISLPFEAVSYTFLGLFSLIFFASVLVKRSLIFYVA